MKVKNCINIFLFELIFYIFDTNTALQSFIPLSVFKSDNIIHLFMQFIEFVILFFLCLRITELKVEKEKLLRSFIVILPVKIVLDILLYYVSRHSALIDVKVLFNKFIWDIFHILYIMFIFTVIVAIWKPCKKEESKYLKIYISILSIGVVCFIISGALLSNFISDIVYKYDIDRIMSFNPNTLDNLPDMQTNFEYYINGASEIYGIASVFIRTLIFISISNIFDAVYIVDERIEKKIFSIDIGCIFMCFILNLCFNNVNIFSGIYHGKAIFEKEPNTITVDYDVWQLLRGVGEKRRIWCACDINYVYIGDEYICKFRTDPLASSDWFVDYGSADYSTIVCETTLIAYKDDNGFWKKIEFCKLDRLNENEKITEALINTCRTGNLEAISFALPYLDRYEPELVIEIPIERKVTNEFLSDKYCSELCEKIAYRILWI